MKKNRFFYFKKRFKLRSAFKENLSEYSLLADLFSIEQLEKHGESLARIHELDLRSGKDKLLARLSENEETLTETYELLTAGEEAKLDLKPAEVWFLDNFYLIKEQIQTARKHLPKSYSKELPRLRSGAEAGLPRVYHIVRELITHVDGLVDEGNLGSIVSSYQKVTPLKLGELWAVPIMLRLAMIENLRIIAMRLNARRIDRNLAIIWADRMLETARKDPKNIILDMADMSRAKITMTSSFTAELVRRLQHHNPALVLPLTWIEQRLAEDGQTTELQLQQDSQYQATNQISISNSITSLRFLTSINWKNFVEKMSVVESILRKDPAGVYQKMNFTTRDNYRHVIEKTARQSSHSEESTAALAIKLAEENSGGADRTAHVGYYLVDKGSFILEKAAGMRRSFSDILSKISNKAPLLYYLGSIFFITGALSAFVLFLISPVNTVYLIVLSLLLLLGFSQPVTALVNWAITILVKPGILPRMDFSEGIPRGSSTLVTVPAMLSGIDNIKDLLNKMEVFYLSNKAENLYFSLLTDFKDASKESMPDDKALFAFAREGIRKLNNKYSQNNLKTFLFFHRERSWNPKEKLWMGYERKRGKLEELNNALRSREKTKLLIEGDYHLLSQIKYVLTLDVDTRLPHNAARQLIECISHPLNAPVYDNVKQRVTAGYTILQPRVVSSISAAGLSMYSRVFGGESGIDPYTRAVSDVYQDLFKEGSFIGKGIYDVDMFARTMKERLPENRILSHDLLEGTYCRSGLISDIQLVDEFPESYSEDIFRRHRWIRGDWQIASWLFPRVPGFNKKPLKNPVSLLSRWKIFDNLRRSIVPVSLTLLIALSWIFLEPSWLGVAVSACIILIPVIPGILQQILRVPEGFPFRMHLQSILPSLGRNFFQAFFSFMTLPYEAFSNIDAVMRTCFRMLFTRRKLLEWMTSGEAKRRAAKSCWMYYRIMIAVPLFTAALGILFFMLDKINILNIRIIFGLWFLSPFLTWWISKPISRHKKNLSDKQTEFLRKISRKTWRFFETFVTASDNWLPPDNYQEEPREALAHRTSPTNIGLMLLSNLGAYDLGYISAGQFIDRTKKSFMTMKVMKKFRGHFFNWYDTRTLESLPPDYISTVDSGNLAGYLLTLKSGLLEIKNKKIFQNRTFGGLVDILNILTDVFDNTEYKKYAMLKKKNAIVIRFQQLIKIIKEAELVSAGLTKTIKDLNNILTTAHHIRLTSDDRSNLSADWWFQTFEDQCSIALEDLIFLSPWLASLEEIKSQINEKIFQMLDNNRILGDTDQLDKILSLIDNEVNKPEISSAEKERCLKLEYQVKQGIKRTQNRIKQLDDMSAQAHNMTDMEYDFLYDKSRELLSIGYNVNSHRRDDSFYDLLASESRLCSFVGIAQGKLPLSHWFSLGRLVTIWKGKVILLSWGGSMFEYLMPQLIMPGYDNTLLGQSCLAVVDKQIAYGHKQGVAWGISESAENITDASLNYQYRSFGVPDLGFKRGLADDLVIAPYASALALMIKPDEACLNMQKLSENGYEGKYGFYEAIDYTQNRLSHEESEAVIRSFMAHHQGMSFISFVNYFRNDLMIKRFESDPLFQTTVLLLQERVPETAPFQMQPSESNRTQSAPEEQEGMLRIFNTPQTPFPEVHLLSNGHYHVMVTNAGGGYSRWRDLSVTRWNEDQTRDNYGAFIYINDVSSDSIWSAAYQPTLSKPKDYEAIFLQSRAEFRRKDQGLDTYTEIAVSPEDDIEHRRVTLSNFTVKTRTIEITSYAEVTLLSPAAEALHPAFFNLFMQTYIDRSRQAILCSRRPRSPDEKSPWMFHLLVVNEREQFDVSYETDRLKFIGRNRTPNNPKALDDDGVMSGTDGSVLDPIVSIRCRFILMPGETFTLGFISGMAETREEAMSLIEKYQDRRLADRVFEMALIHGKVVLQQLNGSEADAQLYGRLAGSILYANRYRRANHSILTKNKRGQSNLWAYSISGDLPIILLRISDKTKIELAGKLIQAHAYWRLKGLPVDLVIWNEDRSGYRQTLNDLIVSLITAGAESAAFDKTGGIFLRYSEQISEEDRILIQTAARIIITDNGGALSEQIKLSAGSDFNIPKQAGFLKEKSSVEIENFRQDNLLFFNGWGGFTHDGREYVIQIKPGKPTPMPWVNVAANKQFGTVISQSGGYTWSENAHEFRLTPWYNDPVSDTQGESIFLRDEITGLFWSPMPSLIPSSSDYLNRHGFGYSVFEYYTNSIKSELWIYVDSEAPVKFWMLKARNDSNTTRRLSATSFLEVVMGDIKSKTQMFVKTEVDSETGALFATNPYNTEFPGRVMFLDSNEARRSITGDRTEFIGRNGNLADPVAMHSLGLSGKTGGGLDPALAVQVYFEIEPGQEKEIVFILGAGKNIEDARNLVLKHRGTLSAYQARERVWQFWNHTLGEINIETPDPAVNMITNGWLLYQSLSARLWGRSGFYQSGGAFGFRDQLQDVMSLVHTKPELIREHILLCASRQFREGDVQHWWHPPQGRGVRTLISDDYLWLPLAVSFYLKRTGDTGVLNEPKAFLEGRVLNQGEESYYDLPSISEDKVSLYKHCKAAIKHALRFGEHGLPLMGSGDWNDGMNHVGIDGKGESVWLAFFLYYVLKQFVPVAQISNDEAFALRCIEEAETLKENIDKNAWDGEWYRRAFFDNGAPLGSLQNEECQIDAVAQCWSVLSGGGNRKKTDAAMVSLEQRLIHIEAGLIKLLDPPFDKSNLEPGYIKGYLPGVRENGGQYTHAAVWTVMAYAEMGDNKKVKDLLDLINPVNHSSTRKKIEKYLVEPYVMAADIYGSDPHLGRGGWTWYTGSASWMYRLIIEYVIGLDLRVDKLYFKPCLPAEWEHFNVHYRFKETVYHLAFHQGKYDKEIIISVDGNEESESRVSLNNDLIEHYVEVKINKGDGSPDLNLP